MSWRRPAILALLAVAACGGGGGSDSGSAATSGPTTTPAVATVTAAPAGPAESSGAPLTAPSSGATAGPPTTAGVAPSGFDTVAATITAADGSVCDVCLWAAVTAEQRQQGLMGVTDLSGADGMIFRWDEPYTGQFWMRDTPTPLSIAFYAADGSFVSSADMTPCLDGPDADCARYPAAGPYTSAIEVAQGALPGILAGPGSRLDVLDTPCPLAD